MDIRKFFAPKATGNNVKKSDDNHDQKKSADNAKASKKRRIIESDSDEDPLPPVTKKSPPSTKKQTPKSDGKPPEKKKVQITASDFFGASPVSRKTEKPSIQAKKTKEESTHDDSDFEAALRQLDKKEAPKKIKKVNGTAEAHSSSEKKTEKPSTSKRKSKQSSSFEMEIVPSPTQPEKKTIVVNDEKPPPKKRKGDGASYASYLHREGPKALGSKVIPEGEEGCLAGLTFIITGVLESMERDETKELIEKYGGKVMTTLSKNTKYIVIGRDAGASKLEKAEKLQTKQIDEDGLLDLVRTLPGTKSPKLKQKKETKLSEDTVSSHESPSKKVSPVKPKSPAKETSLEDDGFEVTVFKKPEKKELQKKESSEKSSTVKKEPPVAQNEGKKIPESSPAMWVDKYKPTSLKQLIGQQGDKSNVKKLSHWLVQWHKNRRLNKKPIPSRFNNAGDDGAGFKAALLSGPPGVGKTTTAQLVSKEAGFDLFELNASDTRSKKSLQQMISQLLGNQTLGDCIKEGGKVSKNHVIVMDEVDGMAGNEDRGGMMELIGFIKSSKVPIICICNDRNHQKIRSLANYCFDLRFQRPRVEQIKAAMMSIAYKEHIKVTPDVLQDVIVASNQDIRQVLHNMSMWSANSKGLSSDQAKSDIGRGTKHIKMSPFDVLREVFAIGNNPKASIMDKSDLFFHDYSLAPLFVQENYVHVSPTNAQGDKKKHLNLLSEAADSICIGDMIDRQIRNQNSWSLLPTQAIFASVVPGEVMKGNLRQMINFPAWLGKNSNRNHMDRILQELHVHMRMRITGNKSDVGLEYLPCMSQRLTEPLITKKTDGVPEVLKVMEDYFLLREDFESIVDLSLWSGQDDPRKKIETKVKSAFTRAYNKESGKNPYSISNVKKKKASAAADADLEAEPEEESEEDDTIEKDAMIKVKKPPKKAVESEASTSKDKKKTTSKKAKLK